MIIIFPSSSDFTFPPLINTHQYTSSGDTSGGSQESVNLFSQSKKRIVGGNVLYIYPCLFIYSSIYPYFAISLYALVYIHVHPSKGHSHSP